MATETVVPDQCTDEKIEKKINEEIKVVEQEDASPSKESHETYEEQKSKAVELASPVACVAESEEKLEDKHIDLSAVAGVQKTVEKVHDTLGLDVPSEGAPKATETPDPKLDVSSVSEPGEEVTEKEPEDQSKISGASQLAVEKPMEQLEVSPAEEQAPQVGNKPEEAMELESKIVEKPESVVEEPEVGKVPEVPELESEIVEKPVSKVEELGVVKEPEDIPESYSKVVEKSESAAEAEDKSQEKSIVEKAEEIFEKPKPKESEKGELVKVDEILVTKVKGVTESLEEEPTCKDQEPLASENSDAVVSTNQETQDGGVSVLHDVEYTKKVEGSGVDDVVEGLSKEVVLEVEKVEEEKEEKNVKFEESTQPETTKTEGASDSNSAKEVTETTCEGVETTREVEVVTENLESSEDVDDSKIDGDLPKQEAPTKSTHKQSNNIISKVKHSIVKVKKAIIGKSPSSKTLSSDAKGDINVK